MPSDDRLGLDNRCDVQHQRKQPIEPNEEQSIGCRQSKFRRNAPAQHVQLMPQHDDLGFQPCLRLERRDHDVEDQAQERDHCGSDYLIASLRPVDGVFGMDSKRPIQLRYACRKMPVCSHRADRIAVDDLPFNHSDAARDIRANVCSARDLQRDADSTQLPDQFSQSFLR